MRDPHSSAAAPARPSLQLVIGWLVSHLMSRRSYWPLDLLMARSENMNSRLLQLLECPRDHSELRIEDGQLCCALGHKYPVVNDVPVFLLKEKERTIGIADASLKAAKNAIGGPLYVDTLGLSEDEKRGIERDWIAGAKIDPAISYLVAATCGWGYGEFDWTVR